MANENKYDVFILGGGVVGASILYTTSKYTTGIKRIRLVERFANLGMVNSHHESNSQTLHDGSIESNYDEKKCIEVAFDAGLLVTHLERFAKHCYTKQGKMLIAFGSQECTELRARFEKISYLYQNLCLIDAAEIERIAPMVMKGRDPKQEVLAIFNPNGYTVDYQAVAQNYVKLAQETDTDVTVSLNTQVVEVKKISSGYKITMATGEICFTKVLVLAAGPHSLMFAKMLGIAQHIGIIPVIGNYYVIEGENFIGVKAYCMQLPKLPFARCHVDPEYFNPSNTRIGPTAQILPMLIRHDYATVTDFLKTSVWSIKGLKAILNIITDSVMMPYMLWNMAYDLPFIGKYLFLIREARQIFPTLQYRQLKKCTGKGGLRPQPVNAETGEMGMDSHFEGENVLVEITPSPGATKSMAIGLKAAKRVVDFLGNSCSFNQTKWDTDFAPVETKKMCVSIKKE